MKNFDESFYKKVTMSARSKKFLTCTRDKSVVAFSHRKPKNKLLTVNKGSRDVFGLMYASLFRIDK